MFRFLVLYILFSTSVLASGVLPEPVATNDPEKYLDIEYMFEVFCKITDARIFNGDSIENTIGGVEIYHTVNETDYVYYYYLQDVIDTCLFMRQAY